MKRIISIVLSLALLIASISTQSCSRKSGCPYNNTKPKTNRKGELKGKRGKTKLFPKKMGMIDKVEKSSFVVK